MIIFPHGMVASDPAALPIPGTIPFDQVEGLLQYVGAMGKGKSVNIEMNGQKAFWMKGRG